MKMLKETSRTFYIPITMLGSTLKQAVGSAYLCMRAIDEIEDHETLAPDLKERLLLSTSELLQENFDQEAYAALVRPYKNELPEVTLRLADWIEFCPKGIKKRMLEATKTMAIGMTRWVKENWQIKTEE